MKNIALISKTFGCLLFIACGSDPGTTQQEPGPNPDPNPVTMDPPSTSSYQAGLQTSGAIGFDLTSQLRTRIEFSAPIVPRTDVIYPAEGASFPTDAKAEADLAHKASLTFKFLLSQCTSYPDVKVPASDDEVLTAAQRSRNYNAIAQCAYEKFSAKPYWIPQLVSDVDICATELGTGWHLPTEAEILGLSGPELTFLGATLAEVGAGAGSSASWGSYYFSLTTYVRGSDGTLKLGSLDGAAKSRISPLGATAAQYKYHFESPTPISLRCVRQTKL